MSKETVIVEVDEEVRKSLESRAKREFLTLTELVSNILRRSVISSKKSSKGEKETEDVFVNIFSKSRRGRKPKKKSRKKTKKKNSKVKSKKSKAKSGKKK